MADTPEELRALEEATNALAQAQRELRASYTAEDIEKLKKAIKEGAEARNAAAQSQKKDASQYKKLNKEMAEATRLLDSLPKTMKKAKTAADGLNISMSGFADVAKDLGAAGLPLLRASTLGLVGAFDKFSAPLRDIEINAIKTFGSLDTESAKLFVEGQKRLRVMVEDQATGQMAVDARLKTLALDPVKAQQQILEEQQKLQGQVGQNLDRFKGEITDPEVILNLRGLRNALGLTADESAVFANRAAAFGTSIQGQFVVAANAAQKFAKSSGVDFKIIAKGQNELRKNTRAFATFSEEQLARVAAASAKTGISLSTMGGGLVDSFDDFDSAAEKAAMLGQSFGISIDAFELFATEDPTERLQMIQEAASRAGVDIANMGRRELNYLSELTGMGVEDTMKALGQGGLEVAKEVAGIDKAGDLQAQLVVAQRATNQSTQALTEQMAKLIPVIAESGKDLVGGFNERKLRLITLQSAEMTEAIGENLRNFIDGGAKAARTGTPGGVLGVVGKASSDPRIKDAMSAANTGFVRQADRFVDKGIGAANQATEAMMDPEVRKGMASDAMALAARVAKSAKDKADKAAALGAAVKDKLDKLDKLGKLRRGLTGNKTADQGSMDEAEVTATGDTNAALRGGRAATATQGPINLVVNVSLPVDGDAIASAAYTGQIRPGVTGEQALQAAAANENPAGQ
jgi:hypothetical protein